MKTNLNQTTTGGIMIIINNDNKVLSSTITTFDYFEKKYKDEVIDIEGDLECYHCGMTAINIMKYNNKDESNRIIFYSDEQNDNYVCDDDSCFASASREADGCFQYTMMEVELEG